MRRWLAVGFLVVGLTASVARAGEPRLHDGGFFLRMAPGIGHSQAEADGFSDFNGASGSFELAIGAVVAKNFAIHATFDGWGLLDSQDNLRGTPLPAHHGALARSRRAQHYDDTHVGMGLWGAGATYWLGTSNVYLTASAGAARLYYNVDFNSDFEDYAHSDTGFAFASGVGKEWWVSDRWGLGAAGTFGYQSIPPGAGGPNFSGPTFAVRFSATLN
jgi:hypothetical protein